ncbi:MAG: manganese efflux pump [Eubacterium sp.]|nr:manganese efflux pump [Eubacterium sp.]
MNHIVLFIFNSILFGIGLAMDAFSVSCANGLAAPDMHISKSLKIAGTFGGFQTAMPLIGWICVHTIAEKFEAFQKFIPWIALGLLLYIGGSMLKEGMSGHAGDDAAGEVGNGTLLMQGVATSIDALSVGFTIAEYNWSEALAESVIIGVVTFVICLAGIRLGKTLGTRLSGKAEILGGAILIAIGLEIFITGVF